jgi:hypothetical protein
MKRILVIGAVIVLIAIVATLLIVGGNLNSLIAATIEKSGREVTGTSVSVSGVEVSLREARGSIDGLSVASPDGFDAREAFVLGNITLALDLKSLREEPIVIEELRIQAPVVNAKFLKDGKSNIDELRKRVQAHSGSGGDGRAKAQKRLRIERFVFEAGKIEVDASALGLEARTVALPAIQLSDIGGREGATPDQIAKIILVAATKQATSAIARSEVSRLIEEKLGGSLTDKAKGLLEKLGK